MFLNSESLLVQHLVFHCIASPPLVGTAVEIQNAILHVWCFLPLLVLERSPVGCDVKSSNVVALCVIIAVCFKVGFSPNPQAEMFFGAMDVMLAESFRDPRVVGLDVVRHRPSTSWQ